MDLTTRVHILRGIEHTLESYAVQADVTPGDMAHPVNVAIFYVREEKQKVWTEYTNRIAINALNESRDRLHEQGLTDDDISEAIARLSRKE